MSGRRPVAVVLHGAGSTPDLVRRALGPALDGLGHDVLAPHLRPGGGVEQHVADLDDLVARTGARVVGGISHGAHVAATWAASPGGEAGAAGDGGSADRDLDGLLLLLPAWTGPPDDVAALTTRAAEDVAVRGTAAVLDEARRGALAWVAAELDAAWPTYGDALAPALRAVGSSPAPDRAALSRVRVPAGVVGLRGDPLHPLAVARAWVGALGAAALVELDVDAPAAGVDVLGAAAVRALARARTAGGLPSLVR